MRFWDVSEKSTVLRANWIQKICSRLNSDLQSNWTWGYGPTHIRRNYRHLVIPTATSPFCNFHSLKHVLNIILKARSTKRLTPQISTSEAAVKSGENTAKRFSTICSQPNASTASAITGGHRATSNPQPAQFIWLHQRYVKKTRYGKQPSRWDAGRLARENSACFRNCSRLASTKSGAAWFPQQAGFSGSNRGVGPYCANSSQAEELLFASPTRLDTDHLMWPTV